MKITSQEEYGLRCLVRLAQTGPGHALTIPEVAAAEGLSIPYVAKLLAVLREAGLIESVRGRTGGYRLAAAPEAIRLGAVLLALGKPLYDDPGYCNEHMGSEKTGSCVRHGACTLRALWQTLEEWMRGALDQLTLADLLQGESRLADLLRVALSSQLSTLGRGLRTPGQHPLPMLS